MVTSVFQERPVALKYSEFISVQVFCNKIHAVTIPVAVQSKAWDCSRFISRGSNTAEGIRVAYSVCCVVCK